VVTGMSNLFNVPVKDGIGIYTITNQQTGKKYIGSSSELLARARLHKNGILRKYHSNKDILEDAIKGCDFRFEIVKIIDGSDCTSFDELRNKMLLEEYRMIKEAISNGENLYNRETINVVNGRLKHIKEDQEKVLKRKNEVYEMLKLPNDKLIYTYKHNIYAKHELKLFEEEILKRMS
jgi:hypothetical protein